MVLLALVQTWPVFSLGSLSRKGVTSLLGHWGSLSSREREEQDDSDWALMRAYRWRCRTVNGAGSCSYFFHFLFLTFFCSFSLPHPSLYHVYHLFTMLSFFYSSFYLLIYFIFSSNLLFVPPFYFLSSFTFYASYLFIYLFSSPPLAILSIY